MVEHYAALNRPGQPLCSVCIANYNGTALLADCLDSVLGQRIDFEVEVIVHDDASSDGSVAFLREHYPQVEVLASTENVGFCISNNRMATHARGQFLLLLNNDAALLPDALATLVRSAGAQIPQGVLTLPQYDWQTGELVDRGCLLDPFHNPVPNLDPARANVAMVIGACLWIPRSLWTGLGGFPTWIESIGEDLYLCCQARLRGFPVQVAADSGYRHRQGASFGGNRVDAGRLSTSYRRRRLSERNKTAVMVICTPGPMAWFLLALHLPLLAFEGAAMTLLRRDTRVWREIYLPAITGVFANWRVLRARRRDIQATRTMGFLNYMKAFVLAPRKLVMLWRYGVPRIH